MEKLDDQWKEEEEKVAAPNHFEKPIGLLVLEINNVPKRSEVLHVVRVLFKYLQDHASKFQSGPILIF